jgi:hypothetical protein
LPLGTQVELGELKPKASLEQAAEPDQVVPTIKPEPEPQGANSETMLTASALCPCDDLARLNARIATPNTNTLNGAPL